MSGLWEHLHAQPVFWLVLTLAAYLLGQFVFQKTKGFPLLSPIIVAVALLVAVLEISGVSYEEYFAGAQTVHLLLGPATVALAIPLFDQRAKLACLLIPILAGLFVGCLTAIVSVILLGDAFGLSHETLLSMVPKSVTTPIAMGISSALGGMPDLTAALVVVTGIFGGLVGKYVFAAVHIKSDVARGLGLGLAAHGMGTSAAFALSPKAGAFGGLAMGGAGIITAFLAPYVAAPLIRWLGL